MALNDYSELNAVHLDVLREVANIGTGNAAASLSQMIGQTVSISVPDVSVLEFAQAIEYIGKPEQAVAGMLLSLKGEISGMIMFLLHKEFVGVLLNALMFIEINSFDEVDEIGLSALQETSNIMSASFVTAMSKLTGINIDISTPSVAIDMLGAIMGTPIIDHAHLSDKAILIKTEFGVSEPKVSAYILLMPDVSSLEKLLKALGIEV